MLSYFKFLQPHHYFASGQIILGICLLVSLVILPSYFFSFDQGGISNYGAEPRTRWLFTAGFSAATLGTLMAAIALPQRSQHRLQLRIVLVILAVLYLLVMMTTFSYKVSPSNQQLHELSALVLFIGMLLTSLWLRLLARKDSYVRTLFRLFMVSLGLGILNFFGVFNILFIIELMAGIVFAMLLTYEIRKLTVQ